MKELNVNHMEQISGGDITIACAVGAIGLLGLWFNPELILVYGGYTATAINSCINNL